MVEKTQKAETRRETSGNTTWKTENFAVTSENSIRSSADNLKANLRFSPEFRSYKNNKGNSNGKDLLNLNQISCLG